MARLAGFEPTTLWSVARYSIQLSYSRIQIVFCVSVGAAGRIRNPRPSGSSQILYPTELQPPEVQKQNYTHPDDVWQGVPPTF